MSGTVRHLVLIGILLILLVVAVVLLALPAFWRTVYPLKYRDLIFENAERHNLDPYLLTAIIFVESKFDKNAVSHRGARGLMQVMPETGKWVASQLDIESFSEEDMFDPELNIRIGSWYFADLMRQFENNTKTSLAAYNAGRGRVERWINERIWQPSDGIGGIPFAETREYVKRVLKVRERYKRIYGSQD